MALGEKLCKSKKKEKKKKGDSMEIDCGCVRQPLSLSMSTIEIPAMALIQHWENLERNSAHIFFFF
jgi:hypothetical protein